jgi:hypothetical protein
MKCRECKNNVLQKSGNRIRLRTKGQLIFEDGVCKAQCFWCGSSIEIPIQIAEGTAIPRERLILTK